MLRGKSIWFLKPFKKISRTLPSCQTHPAQLLLCQRWRQGEQRYFTVGKTCDSTLFSFCIEPKKAPFHSLQHTILSSMSFYNPSVTSARHKSRRRQQNSDVSVICKSWVKWVVYMWLNGVCVAKWSVICAYNHGRQSV